MSRGASSAGSASFNSATAMMPWRQPTDTAIEIVGPTLQFGHGDDAVETARIPKSGTSRVSIADFERVGKTALPQHTIYRVFP